MYILTKLLHLANLAIHIKLVLLGLGGLYSF